MFRQIKLPPEWQDSILQELGQDPEELNQKRAKIKRRQDILFELYIEGALSSEEMKLQRRQYQFQLADLQNSQISDIITAECYLRQLEELEEDSFNKIEIKKLLQALVVAAYAQGVSLSAVQFSEATYPLIKQASLKGEMGCFYSGSDGN